MEKLGNSPFVWLEFNKRGAAVDAGAKGALEAAVAPSAITDIVVVAHGWKNDRTAASKLYTTLWGNVTPKFKALASQNIVVAGVLWPARKYAPDFDEDAALSSGAVGAGAANARDLDDVAFEEALDAFSDLFDDQDAASLARTAAAEDEPPADAAKALVDAAVRLVELDAATDPELSRDAETFEAVRQRPQGTLMDLMAPPAPIPTTADAGRALGVGGGKVLHGPKAAVARLLNQFTYFEMKKRAGVVGDTLGRLLSSLAATHPIRLHLIGHSFGARLATAAASTFGASPNISLVSLTMLQGAFSHHALSTDPDGKTGAYVGVLSKPAGPICVTHTHNDRACTVAYALASRLSRDTVSAIGDANDRFGAMGANGPQRVAPALVRDFSVSSGFKPERAMINRFKADTYVVSVPGGVDAHNNVANSACGELVAATLEA